MPYKSKRYLQKILMKFIDDLKSKLEEDKGVIIVEGIHDSKILELLGLPKPLILDYRSRRLDEILLAIKARKLKYIYLFLDRDQAGKYLAYRISTYLQKDYKVINVWTIFDSYFKKLGFKTIKKVEELKTLAYNAPIKNSKIIQKLRNNYQDR